MILHFAHMINLFFMVSERNLAVLDVDEPRLLVLLAVQHRLAAHLGGQELEDLVRQLDHHQPHEEDLERTHQAQPADVAGDVEPEPYSIGLVEVPSHGFPMSIMVWLVNKPPLSVGVLEPARAMGGHEFEGDCGKAVLPEVLLAVASEQAHVAAPVDVHVHHAALEARRVNLVALKLKLSGLPSWQCRDMSADCLCLFV